MRVDIIGQKPLSRLRSIEFGLPAVFSVDLELGGVNR